MNFTKNGLLIPNEAIQTTIPLLYDTFVKAFPTSRTRTQLFHEWTRYNQLLIREIGQEFVQWVNGSFVTLKPNPNDIDIVSFVPYRLYERHHRTLDNLWADNWEREGIDAYFVKVYPENHPAFESETKRDWDQWTRRYSLTKPDDLFVQHPKGFLTVQLQ